MSDNGLSHSFPDQNEGTSNMSALHKWIDLGSELDELASDQAAWSQATFGTDAERGPVGSLRHLAKEAEETVKAWIINNHASGDQGDVREEFADCLLLVLDASRRARITPLELIRAAAEKMTKNKARKWSKPTDDQPVEHVRDGEPTSPQRGEVSEADQLKAAIRDAGFGIMQAGGRLSIHDVSQKALADEERTAEVIAENIDLNMQLAKIAKFKKYVHDRLDAAGVPIDPASPHQAEGCRIGGRLDVLIGERDELRRRVKLLEVHRA